MARIPERSAEFSQVELASEDLICKRYMGTIKYKKLATSGCSRQWWTVLPHQATRWWHGWRCLNQNMMLAESLPVGRKNCSLLWISFMLTCSSGRWEKVKIIPRRLFAICQVESSIPRHSQRLTVLWNAQNHAKTKAQLCSFRGRSPMRGFLSLRHAVQWEYSFVAFQRCKARNRWIHYPTHFCHHSWHVQITANLKSFKHTYIHTYIYIHIQIYIYTYIYIGVIYFQTGQSSFSVNELTMN